MKFRDSDGFSDASANHLRISGIPARRYQNLIHVIAGGVTKREGFGLK